MPQGPDLVLAPLFPSLFGLATICAFSAIRGLVAIPGATSGGLIAIPGATIIGALDTILGATIIDGLVMVILGNMSVLGNIPCRLIVEALEVRVVMSR